MNPKLRIALSIGFLSVASLFYFMSKYKPELQRLNFLGEYKEFPTARTLLNETTVKATSPEPSLENKSTPWSPPGSLCDYTKGKLYLVVTTRELADKRLGNQMFIYASTLGIARMLGRQFIVSPGQSIDRIFQIRNLGESHEPRWVNMREKMYGVFDTDLVGEINKTCSNISIGGYLQSWKYFEAVQAEIRMEFTLRKEHFRKALRTLTGLQKLVPESSLVIGVHVRRGDFLSSRNHELGYRSAEKSYFFKAFDWMKARFPDKRLLFYVASDDLEWCRQNIAKDDVHFMVPASPGEHFALLANCHHVIMSSGTFGWWAAWVAGGLVVYFNGFPFEGSTIWKHFKKEDYYPPHWVGMEN